MKNVDAMSRLTAGELLELWQICREKFEDPLERTLMCNAAILQRSCSYQGTPVYQNEMEVLRDMTPGEMETLLVWLADGEPEQSGSFDFERFAAMKGE